MTVIDSIELVTSFENFEYKAYSKIVGMRYINMKIEIEDKDDLNSYK